MAARVLALIVMAMVCGCRSRESGPPQQPGVTPAPATAPTASTTALEMRLGWVTGSCLATANKSLAAASAVTVVSVEGKPSIVEGRVVGATTSDKICPALLQDRRATNESKYAFYQLKLPAPVDLGIGVAGAVTTVAGGIDLNGDGGPETFTSCTTSEGVSFRVWRGPAYQGTPLWSAYYYLGYDTEATCPS